MGEAKRKTELVRREILSEIDKWMEPASNVEATLVAAISALPKKRIERQPKHVLEYARMEARQCHVNCFSYVRLDPEQRTRIIHGWMITRGNYLLHSIVERDGHQTCITPVHLDDGGSFDFVVDPDIVCKITPENKYVFTRKGQVLDMVGLRSDPETMIAINAYLKERLLAGVSYDQANREIAKKFPKA